MKLYYSDGSFNQHGQNTVSRGTLSYKRSFLFVTVMAVLLSNGCAVLGLRQDLSILDQTAEVSGKVAATHNSESPIFVALYQDKEGKQTLYAYQIAYSSGEFRFLMPPGTYYLFAFEDKNEDATFQPDEWAGWYGDLGPLTATAGDIYRNVTLTLRAPAGARLELPQRYPPSLTAVPMELSDGRIGTVAPLSDPRFGPKYASRGVWEPVKFIREPGAGIFFLGPYEEGKIPILFAHGSGGYPQQWVPIIENLDRSRFQPWILHYPSGLRLGMLGEFLEKYLVKLQMKYRFGRLFIVAHSMGGLISRSALNHNIENRQVPFITLLVTISTPWQGHPTAAYGVDQSPLIVPSWYDMVPGSSFLEGLHSPPLPPGVTFSLLFGFRGEETISGALSDGGVLLSSMLDNDMQRAASEVYGFDEDHGTILKSPAVIQELNRIFDKAEVVQAGHKSRRR